MKSPAPLERNLSNLRGRVSNGEKYQVARVGKLRGRNMGREGKGRTGDYAMNRVCTETRNLFRDNTVKFQSVSESSVSQNFGKFRTRKNS